MMPRSFTKIFFLICIYTTPVELRKIHLGIQDNISISQVPIDSYIPSLMKQLKSAVDIDQFITDEALLRKYIRRSLQGTIQLKPESRRVQKFIENHDRPNLWNKNNPEDINYITATNHQFRTKVLDSMLQLVYMARHYFKQFEKRQYIDKTSINFRVGFICKKLRRIFKNSVRIFEWLNSEQKKKKWGQLNSVTAPLTLHHKVAKMYVDFEYYYLVLKKIHKKGRPRDPPQYIQPVWQLGTIE